MNRVTFGWAHPRAGGENDLLRAIALTSFGSSPRGRGKLKFSPSLTPTQRLIPARAGKTVVSSVGCWAGWAHPRAGGENPWHARSVICAHGSSPRGRGKRAIARPRDGAPRLIPARAGKTCSRLRQGRSIRAHPRAGGENFLASRNTPIFLGSSPRGRGKPDAASLDAICERLIPARAGKTRGTAGAARADGAHPRAGGENTSLVIRVLLATGSSPRGRGKPPNLPTHHLTYRLIPARAGKTSDPGVPTHTTTGSSPRGRGKPKEHGRLRDDERRIPARAGKT